MNKEMQNKKKHEWWRSLVKIWNNFDTPVRRTEKSLSIYPQVRLFCDVWKTIRSNFNVLQSRSLNTSTYLLAESQQDKLAKR